VPGGEQGLDAAILGGPDDLPGVLGGQAGAGQPVVPRGRLPLGLEEQRLDDGPGPGVQLVRAQAFGAAGEGLVDQVRVGVGLAPDRRQVLDGGQDHRGSLASQDLAQRSVDLPEVPEHRLLLHVDSGPVAVEDPPGGHAAPVGDIQLQLPLGFLALQGVANPQRNPGQVDLFQPVAGSLQQPDLVLAECQDEEVAVAGQQRQQRADVEPVSDHGQLRKVQGHPERPPPSRPAEQGQAVALVLPEQAVIK
jgi:hypothetical protein